MTEILQGTDEWKQLRLGKVTASRLGDVLATIKSGEAATRANYRAELVAERLTGKPGEGFSNDSIRWGTETEPYARAAYELATDSLVDQIAFVNHPTIEMAGASPDGLVGEDGLLEIKCPNTSTHISTLLNGKVPSKYLPQVHWQMACTGRKWVDFVSFDPRMPEGVQLFIKRVERDQTLILEYELAVVDFLKEVDATVEKLLNLRKAA